MLILSLGIVVSFLTALIALLSLAGGYPNIQKFFSRICFPPSKFFVNAMKAIEKLQALGEKEVASNGKEIKFGSVQPNDVGFVELVKVLKENKMWEGEIQRIMLVENESPLKVGDYSPEIVRVLVVRDSGKQEILRTDPFDPAKAIRDLKDWAEAITRKRLANWIVILVAIWLAINTFIICIR